MLWEKELSKLEFKWTNDVFPHLVRQTKIKVLFERQKSLKGSFEMCCHAKEKKYKWCLQNARFTTDYTNFIRDESWIWLDQIKLNQIKSKWNIDSYMQVMNNKTALQDIESISKQL